MSLVAELSTDLDGSSGLVERKPRELEIHPTGHHQQLNLFGVGYASASVLFWGAGDFQRSN